jgi:hypothetical protein
MLLKGPEGAKVKVVGWRWGKFFSLRACIIRPVAFSSTKSCRKKCARNQSCELTIGCASISAIVRDLSKGMGG